MAEHMEFEEQEDIVEPGNEVNSRIFDKPEPLFPAYLAQKRETKLSDDKGEYSESAGRQELSGIGSSSALDWLSLDSFSQANVNALLTLQKPTGDRSEQNIVGDNVYEKEVAKEKVHKKKKRKKEKYRLKEIKTEPVESSVQPLTKDTKEPSIYDEINQFVFIEDTGLALERAFRVDKKPDYENLSFDSFYKNHIARYRTLVTLPVGLDSKSLLYLSLLMKQPAKKKHNKGDRYYSNSNIKSLNENTSSFLSAQETLELKNPEFVPLGSSSRRLADTRKEKTPEGIYDPATLDYLSGISIRNVKGSLAQEKDDTTSEAISKEDLWQRLSSQETADYNKRLRENPKDEQLWLNFVALQDELMKSDPYGRDKLDGKRLEVACLERKLAILDRALAANPRSVEIAILSLNICHFLWDRDKLSAEWKRLTFLHPSQPAVWHHYLQFLQSSFSNFSVQTAIKGYVKAISTLAKVNEGTLIVHTVPVDLEEKMLDLVFEFAYFLLSSGYSERALSTYQALVEFNFFPPNLPENSAFSDWIAFFEPFWDSGVARVGESGANGWGKVVMHKLLTSIHSTGFTDLNEREDAIITTKNQDYEVWYEFEVLRENSHWLPWRPDFEKPDEDPCEDLERMVSVDLVTCVLFKIQNEVNRFRLVLQFLALLGVVLPGEQHFTQHQLYTLCVPSELQFKNKPKSLANILKLPTVVSLEDIDSFILNFISQIKPVLSENQKLELELIFTRHKVLEVLNRQAVSTAKAFASCIKLVKKTVKTVLSEEANRNNLYLWSEYLRLELIFNNLQVSKKVFSTIYVAQQRSSNIWRFIWSYMKAMFSAKVEVSNQEVLYILTCLTSGEKYNPKQCETTRVAILKARTGFEAASKALRGGETQDCFLVLEEPSNYVSCNICYAFFLHLSGFSTAESIFERLILDSALSPTDLKEAHLGRLHLQLFCNSPLRTLKIHLEAALKAFPSSTSFLGLLFDCGGGSYLMTKTRRYFSKLLCSSNKDGYLQWIFAIVFEINHLQTIQSLKKHGGEFPEVGIVCRVRSLFEKALKLPNMLCGHIWRMYIQFEVHYGTRGRAKSVFLRSLQNCPGFKLLYMDACVYFPEDLKMVIELMSEKDIRLRTPLEEVHMLMEHAASVEKASLSSVEDDNVDVT